jgi:hypothetical protein
MAGLTERIYGHFKEQQVVHFATVEGRQPRVRPMTVIHCDDSFYMITGARGGKEAIKLKQMRARFRHGKCWLRDQPYSQLVCGLQVHGELFPARLLLLGLVGDIL